MGTTGVGFFVCRVCVVSTVAAMLLGAAWAASKEKVIYSFSGGSDGGDPMTALTFDSAGNAYGVTAAGGDFGFGTVFKLTRGSNGHWTESVLYSFTGGSDGNDPHGGVILDDVGNIYGTTVAGGSGGCTGIGGCGVVFKLTHSGGQWNESVLYNFTGGKDGFGPGGGLVFDKKGNLYGTTPDGGACSACGVVYELSLVHGGWKQKVIHSFTGGKDGAVGSLGLLLLDNGKLFGIAELGGDLKCGCGAVFELSPVAGGKWNFSTLYAFKGQPNAGSPYGGLIADSHGHLYGTTYFGGKNGAGAVFKLARDSKGEWQESVLYSFNTTTDGNNPTSTLFLDKLGNLWGTTSAGGDSGCTCGSVFKLTPIAGGKWKESVVHNFKTDPDGANPYYGLVLDKKTGDLYSTTAAGGTHGQGTIFQITP